MTPPEQSSFPRLVCFSAHRPDNPSMVPGNEVPREPERYENLTCGCFALLLLVAAGVAWAVWMIW